MLSFDRISGDNGCIELDSLEPEATPEPAMTLGTCLHLAEISILNTTIYIEGFVSIAIEPPSIAGYRKPIYSHQPVPTRITLWSMKL